jgi:hypothetical protein
MTFNTQLRNSYLIYDVQFANCHLPPAQYILRKRFRQRRCVQATDGFLRQTGV